MDQTKIYAENQTIIGYFENRDQAEQGLRSLSEAGFTSANIGMAHSGASSRDTSSSQAKETGRGTWEKIKEFFEGASEPYADEPTRGDRASSEITNPEDSNFAGYNHDDLEESLTGFSIPEYRSRYFSGRLRSNPDGAIVSVKAGSRTTEAERILRNAGADLGDTVSETTEYADTNRPSHTEDTQNVQLLGEVLRVHKDRVSRGEAVVRKEIITETQNIHVPVTREELVVERRPVSTEAQARGKVGEDTEIRIPLTEETVSIDKGTIVREEVAVGKKPLREVRDLSGEVRREELVVEDETKDDQQNKRAS